MAVGNFGPLSAMTDSQLEDALVSETIGPATRAVVANEIERRRNIANTTTLRDQFAMAALTGLLTSSVGQSIATVQSWQIADAMMKAREG